MKYLYAKTTIDCTLTKCNSELTNNKKQNSDTQDISNNFSQMFLTVFLISNLANWSLFDHL